MILFAPAVSGLHKSDDEGLTWSIATGLSSWVWNVTQDPGTKTMYALDVGGKFYTSTDYGDTWTFTGFTFPSVAGPHYSVEYVADDILLGGGSSIIFDSYLAKSTNFGVSWTERLSSGPYSVGIPVSTSSIYDLGSGTVLVANASDLNNSYLNKSVDYGETWTQILLPVTINIALIYDILDLGGGVLIAAGSDHNDDVCAMYGEASIWRSSDNGDTWTQVYHPGGAAGGILSLCQVSSSSIIASGGGIGGTTSLVRSLDNGVTWTPYTTFLDADQLLRLEAENEALNVGLTGTVYKTIDGGASWSPISTIGGRANNLSLLLGPDPLAADFEADITSGLIGTTVSFTDLSTGGPAAWDWDFGDGSSHSTEQNPTHRYPDVGSYDVTLEVTSGTTSTLTKPNYIVINPVEDIEIKADFITALSPSDANFKTIRSGGGLDGGFPCESKVQFLDLSTGTIDSWLWDFGDGGTSTEQHPEYTYPEPGVYTVTLTVDGPSGSDTATKENYVTIGQSIVLETDEEFLQGYRLMKDDLNVRFYSLNVYMPQGHWNLYSPYQVRYEIGFVHPDSGVYYRIGSEERIPVEISAGVFRANFIVGDDWSTGEYRIVWKYVDEFGGPTRAKCQKFLVNTAGIFDGVLAFVNSQDLPASMNVIP